MTEEQDALIKECQASVSVMLEIYGKVFGYDILTEVLKKQLETVKGKAAGEALKKFRENVL